MIKIAQIRWCVPTGGPERMLHDLAVYLDRGRFDMRFFFLAQGGLYVDKLRAMGYICSVIPARSGYDIQMRWQLAKQLRAFCPNIVHEHGVPPLVRPMIASAVGAHLLSFEHGEIEINRRKGKLWQNWLNGIEYKLWSERVIVNSSANARLVRATNHLAADRVQVIQLGLNLADFQFPITNAREGVPSGLTIGYVGRIQNYDKGTDLLPLLARQLIDHGLGKFKIVVVGDGPDSDAVKKIALDCEVADRFEFLGRRNDIPQVMALMDILVVPSRMEAFGLVAIEALAVGTRVAAFAVGGLTEILTGCSSARLVAAGDIAAMADAVLDLWETYGKKRPSEARHYVESRFDARRMTEDMMGIYQEFGCRAKRWFV
jgi:glycosyltransferase involved in cell wall biosynthesis